MPNSAAELVAQKFPPIGRYYPHLGTLSAPQAAFLLLDCREAFYGGAAGGGKSDALLLAALQYVDVPGYHALLLRRTFPELEGADGLIAKAHEWLGPSRAAGEIHWNEQKHRWTFPSGATVQFGHVKDEKDKYAYQGQAYQFVGFDELTHFTDSIYTYIAFTRSRRVLAHERAGIPVRARAASNPGNIGHGWVKERFIEKPNPGTIFIPAKIDDNPGLDRGTYEADLTGNLTDELRQQLMDGNWDVHEGLAYTMFDASVHVVDWFSPPESWGRFEQMDFGSTAPTAWHLLATDYDGNLIVFDEYYSPGFISEHAAAIKQRREGGWEARDENGWVVRNRCFADPSVFAEIPDPRGKVLNKLGQPATTATEFAERGIGLTPANNRRRPGYLRLAELLKPDPERRFPAWHPRNGEMGSPRYFITRNCPMLTAQIKAAPLKPDGEFAGELVDPAWETTYGHAHAAARYGAMSRPGPSKEPEVVPDDPRAALIQRRVKRHQEAQRRPRAFPERFREL